MVVRYYIDISGNRDHRKPMKILLADERVEVHLSTKEDFQRTAKNIEQFLLDHPDYRLKTPDQPS